MCCEPIVENLIQILITLRPFWILPPSSSTRAFITGAYSDSLPSRNTWELNITTDEELRNNRSAPLDIVYCQISG